MKVRYRVVRTIRGPEFYKIEKQLPFGVWVPVCDCYGMVDVEATIERMQNKVVKEFYIGEDK